MIPVRCPTCGKSQRIQDAYAGRQVDCPACGEACQVPDLARPAAPPKSPPPPAPVPALPTPPPAAPATFGDEVFYFHSLRRSARVLQILNILMGVGGGLVICVHFVTMARHEFVTAIFLAVLEGFLLLVWLALLSILPNLLLLAVHATRQLRIIADQLNRR